MRETDCRFLKRSVGNQNRLGAARDMLKAFAMQSPDYRARDDETPFADIVRVEQCGKLLGNSVSNPDRRLAGAGGVDVDADCCAGIRVQCLSTPLSIAP